MMLAIVREKQRVPSVNDGPSQTASQTICKFYLLRLHMESTNNATLHYELPI